MTTTFKAFGLSNAARSVLAQVKAGRETPVQISKETDISRPAIYAILAQLEEQGLVACHSIKGARHWRIASASAINRLLEKAREEILGSREEKEVLYQEGNVGIKVYRGSKTISEVMRYIFQEHRGETCIGFQGDNVFADWRDLLGAETIHELNKSIKKNGMVIQVVIPEGSLERSFEIMGFEWAKHFEGRAYRVNEIDEEYFKHKGEMFLFKDSVYLISMREELVIEIKHSQIQKMLYLLFEYVQNTSKVIDGNEILRELMVKDTAA
ncbi:MAG: winged helix-turn-helix domain-containing protein [Patescibacteria group bacterium]